MPICNPFNPGDLTSVCGMLLAHSHFLFGNPEIQGFQKGKRCIVVLIKKGTVLIVKNAERKRASLVANVGDINRPLRVRPVRAMGREWWAVAAEDTWPGMVMDLRRLGFEAMAWEDEVLVREGSPAYDLQMEGPAAPGGLKPFPLINPTIQIRKESSPTNYADFSYLDEYDEDEDSEEEHELEPEDLSE